MNSKIFSFLWLEKINCYCYEICPNKYLPIFVKTHENPTANKRAGFLLLKEKLFLLRTEQSQVFP